VTQKEIRIEVPVLARVEGEGALELDIQDGQLQSLRLRIYEPPRLFEKLLEGRSYTEVPDIVARICGICPVAYQMSAVHAIESIFHLDAGPWVRAMRRLLYCGEWIESHALHIHLLALPDYLGFDSVIGMAGKYPDEVRRGLKLQGLGNRIIDRIGGRSVHPVSVRAGGFTAAPRLEEMQALHADLNAALQDAEDLLRWTCTLPLPDDEQDFTCVALQHPDEYPMNEGRIRSDSGLDISIEEYPGHFSESQVPHSTALHSHLQGKPYLVGPLARINLNHERLPEPVRQVLTQAGIHFPSRNMFHSIIARAAEIHFAILEAVRILQDYQPPSQPFAQVSPQAGTGFGCTEAPRGMLWHRYSLDAAGNVVNATIIPPTSQNQARIEEDLRRSLQAFGLDREDDAIRALGETVIRNYDPCISCATHFLRMKVHRT
jgi:coenzyme F420-reducing hydrogenase alpha subunit